MIECPKTDIDLTCRVLRAALAYEKLPLAEKYKMQEAQRRSWVTGEMMLAHSDMTKQMADDLYDKVLSK